MDVKPGLLWVFDQHAGAHQGAGDASDEGIEQAFEFKV